MNLAPSAVKLNPKDLKLKLEIVRNVFEACQAEEKTELFKTVNIRNRFAAYTGCGMRIIPALLANLSDDCASEPEVRERRTKLHHLASGEQIAEINELIAHFYIDLRIIPTQLAFTPPDKRSYCLDSNDYFKPLGFENRFLPMCSKAMFVEQERYANERYMYLRRMQSFRDNNSFIVYVDIYETEKKPGKTYKFLFAALPRFETLKFIPLQPSTTLEMIWSQIIMPQVPIGTVVVHSETLNNEQGHVPKATSSRHEMVEWLIQEHVPFSEDMHKSELLRLIEEKCDGEDVSSGDRGFTPVQRPVRLWEFDIFRHLFKEECLRERVKEHLMKQKQTAKVKNENDKQTTEWTVIKLNVISKLDNEMREREQERLKRDADLEYVLESILEMVKNNKLTDEDFNDGDFYEEEMQE